MIVLQESIFIYVWLYFFIVVYDIVLGITYIISKNRVFVVISLNEDLLKAIKDTLTLKS